MFFVRAERALHSSASNDKGASIVEYLLLVSIISIAVVGMVQSIGASLNSNICMKIAGGQTSGTLSTSETRKPNANIMCKTPVRLK